MLTPKQQMFVKEYLIDLNATQSAIRAGYTARSAEVTAWKMLRNAKIADAVQVAMDMRSKKVAVTSEDVLESILRIRAKAEEADKHNDALRANELLGKHLKMFTDKLELSGHINFESLTLEELEALRSGQGEP